MSTVRHCAEQLAASVALSEDASTRSLRDRLENLRGSARIVTNELECIATNSEATAELDFPGAPEAAIDSFQTLATDLRVFGETVAADRLDALCSPYGAEGPTLNGLVPEHLLRDVASDEVDEDPDTDGIDYEADATMWREASTAKDAEIDRLTAIVAGLAGPPAVDADNVGEQGPATA